MLMSNECFLGSVMDAIHVPRIQKSDLDFTCAKDVGEGHYGKVLHIRHKDGSDVALKYCLTPTNTDK